MAYSSKYSRGPGDNILSLLENESGQFQPAMMEGPDEENGLPGEYVLNRNAVDAIGKDVLDRINFDVHPRFDSPQPQQSTMQVGGMLGDMLGMQTGGDTLTYGGARTEVPGLEGLYETFGYRPESGEERRRFEKRFTYDPKREDVWFGEYGESVAGLGRKARTGLGAAYEKSFGLGRGFSGFGEREYGMGQARSSMLEEYMAGKMSAKSTLFKGVRGEREKYLSEAGRALGILKEAEGTMPYGHGLGEYHVPVTEPGWSPRPNPEDGDTYNFGGDTYYWNQDTNSWETESDWNRSQREEDPYG